MERLAPISRLPLLLALFLSGCSAASAPPNVLLVVVDTLRADRLGAYGSRRELSPFLDELASTSYVFHAAYAASSLTTPSVASLMTGRYPSRHGAVSLQSALPDAEVTLAERLRERGYGTAGFTANIVLPPGRGHGQGFDVYGVLPMLPLKDDPMPARGWRLNQRAFAWLDEGAATGSEPFFLYLQYMEPHVPYAPSAAALERAFGGADPQVDTDTASHVMRYGLTLRWNAETRTLAEGVYDAEVFELDSALRALFLGLERRGLLERTIVIVTADHGEEFMDHGGLGHGQSLYDELIRIPLLVRLPGQRERVDLDAVVSHVDLLPTVLAWAGAEAAPAAEGRDLAALLAGKRSEGDRAFAELLGKRPPNTTDHRRAIVTASGALIQGTGSEPEIFAGPGASGAGPPPPRRRADLERALEEFAAGASAEPETDLRPVDASEAEQLRVLGYLAAEPD